MILLSHWFATVVYANLLVELQAFIHNDESN